VPGWAERPQRRLDFGADLLRQGQRVPPRRCVNYGCPAAFDPDASRETAGWLAVALGQGDLLTSAWRACGQAQVRGGGERAMVVYQ
jgi:hypothetical protein